MRRVFDFEVHSKYSRACSKNLVLPNIGAWAKRKGIDVIGTGDFTHPKWFSDIREQLQEQGNGFLKLKKEYWHGDLGLASGLKSRISDLSDVNFILSSEISSIYSHNGRTRRIHNIVLADSIAHVEEIRAKLESRGAKLGSDGRPIVGMPSKDLLQLILEVSENCVLIPAHVWTPYFGLFGSMSGYDSVEECFEDLSDRIFALETGLSADPEMFWRISKLDRFCLVSCSDAHSLPRIGRECNIFDFEDSEFGFKNFMSAIKQKDKSKFLSTLEYYPEEGKYHFDGHRNCGISLHPSQTKKYKGICPKCGKKLTVGVLSRTEELSDRPEGYKPKDSIPGRHFVVLEEIIAAGMNKTVSSKKVQAEYLRLTDKYSEFEILFDLPIEELSTIASKEAADAIIKMRNGEVEITPGFDGEYGKIKLFDQSSKSTIAQELPLF